MAYKMPRTDHDYFNAAHNSVEEMYVHINNVIQRAFTDNLIGQAEYADTAVHLEETQRAAQDSIASMFACLTTFGIKVRKHRNQTP